METYPPASMRFRIVALPRPDALSSYGLSMVVVEERGNRDLPTGDNKRATFDLHSDTTSMLLT